MSPYRESARPDVVVGDRIRVEIGRLDRLRLPSNYACWHEHEGTVRSIFSYDCELRTEGSCLGYHWSFLLRDPVCLVLSAHCLFSGERGATLDLDEGGGINMPLRFLARTSGPRNAQGAS